MYSLYGFITIPGFVSNEPGKISKLGQLSKYGLTFSIEVGDHSDKRYPDVKMISLDSWREKERVEVTLDYYAPILKMSQWIYERSIAGQISTNPIVLKQELNAQFKDEMTIADVGPIKQFKHYLLPDRIELSIAGTEEENLIQIWYADESIRVEYPETTFKPLLPVTPIDLLHGDRDQAITLIKKITEESHNQELDALIGDQPETGFITQMINWTDPNNSDIFFPCPFSCVYHGPTGNNLDLIREEWRNEIDRTSSISDDLKAKYWPDLYLPTEFFIVPFWDRYSLPNQTESSGLYSPTVPYEDQMKYAKKYFKGYSADHISQNMCVSGSSWESIGFVSCGNERNYKVPYRFDKMWPEYAAIDTRSPDFSRINPKTREFILSLHSLFLAASTATPKSLLPSGMTRVERDGVFYLTISLDRVAYLCPIKYNFAME